MKKTLFFIFLIIFFILLITGIILKQYEDIYNFGRFICFDCIGL